MPKKKKNPAKGKPSRKSAPTNVGNLSEVMGNLRIRDASEFGLNCFSFDWKNPVMTKDYVKNDTDKFELEILVHPMGKDHFKCVLSKCGKGVTFWHGTPEFFGEEKQMKEQMGRDQNGDRLYRKNDPRVQGHKKCVQAV